MFPSVGDGVWATMSNYNTNKSELQMCNLNLLTVYNKNLFISRLTPCLIQTFLLPSVLNSAMVRGQLYLWHTAW
jgi:hypothetical protein